MTAQELDANLSPTGKQYSYQTDSDLGTFTPTSAFGSQYIGVSANGYYYDEAQGAVSTGPITLTGYSDLATDTVLNVNLLTALAYQRIQHLVVTSKLSFAAARSQAETEVLAALNIPPGSYGSFSTLDLAGHSDGDHILTAISTLFVTGNTSGTMSALMANFQSDLGANGKLTVPATKAALATAAKSLDAAAAATNLTHEYSSLGLTFTAADINDWIDRDGDGVVGKFKFSVPDATSASTFTLPSSLVDQIASTTASVTGGQLSVNGTVVTGPVTIMAGDLVAVSPGGGTFPNGVVTVYLLSGGNRVARVSFVVGLLGIMLTPSAPSLPKGLTQQFKATGTFTDTSTADLTGSVIWTSGSPTVASIDGASGLATALSVGSSAITATSGSVSGTTSLSVTAASLESVAITPSSGTVGISNTVQLSALGSYSDGSTADVTRTVAWSTSDPTLASISASTGLLTGVALGPVSVSATRGAVTASVPFTVIPTTWHQAASMSTARDSFTATLLANGKVLAAGGLTNDAPGWVASAELYDPTADTWSTASSMPAPRWGHTATLLQNGQVLIAGGASASSAPGSQVVIVTSTELYHPDTNTWTAGANLLSQRVQHTATLLPNGKVLVVGGLQEGPGTAAEIYDPIANNWTPAADLPFAPVFGHTATLLANGKVLVAGGITFLANPTNVQPPPTAVLSSVAIYDAATNTWSAAANMLTARSQHGAALLASGKVLVVGGDTNGTVAGTAVPVNSAEIYDPVADTWTAAASLGTVTAGGVATLLPTGKVLFAGGVPNSGTPFLSSAQLYDPAADLWSAAPNMITGRAGHSVVLLNTGRVLAVGGASGNGSDTILASAELFP
ncbi:MAG TPA: kelch repeat-containing protein [Steroidobacteraceae bacterium]|nr:kelch repeat-containing protein [Steroidobacteraceae bacterium]